MVDETHYVIQFPLMFLKGCGRNPYMCWRNYMLSTALYTISFSVMYVSILANLFFINGDVLKFIENSEAMSAVLQMYGKVAVATVFRNRIVTLIDTAKTMNYDGCSSTTKEEIKAVLKNTERVQKVYGVAMMSGAVLAMITPIFTKQCVTGMWNIPDQENLYIAIMVVQEIACPLYIASIIGIDSLFLALSMLLVTQFKVLCSRLKDIQTPAVYDENENKRFLTELKECVKLHDFLLRYGKLLSDTYSPIMLLEFMCICMTSFAEMYLILKSDDMLHFARGILLFFTYMMELALYCVAASITTDAAAEVADAIYGSNWYSNYVPKLRTTLVTMIGRAQHKLLFTAGGLSDINLITLITVSRFAWSVCTIMRGLRKD